MHCCPPIQGIKSYLYFGTGTGKQKKPVWCLRQARDIQENIPVVWDGNRKTQISFPLKGMETESALEAYFFLKKCIEYSYNKNMIFNLI